MRTTLATKLAWLEKRQKTALLAAIASYVIVISWLCFAKYARLGYDAIDLAYFNQVFWNTVHGRLFQQSIHPHLSLGDHAELAILLLAPFYALLQDPRTLLAMQSAVLALGAWPAYLLAKERFSGSPSWTGRAAPLLFGLAWLANPFLQNIGLFEFHILAFALTPLMFALLAYRRGRKGPFLFWTILALLCREDVALVVMTVPLLAWIERKPRFWRIAPLVLGAAWFLGAMKLIAHFSPGGGYKYGVYYSWLGDSLPGMAAGLITHPVLVAAHLLTLANAEMFAGFLLPYFFLPLLGPAPLVLALGPAAQMLLAASGGGELVFDTHYATLFLPALTLAAMEGYAAFPGLAGRALRLASPRESEVLGAVCLGIAAVYGASVMGPLPTALARAARPGEAGAQARIARGAIARIPPDAPVAASYALLPLLSSRERFYAAHYLFLGVTQFGQADYPLPADLRYTAFDLDDLLTYRAQFPQTNWTAPRYAGGLARLEAAVGTPVLRDGRFVIFDRQAATAAPQGPPPDALPSPAAFGGIRLVGASARLEKRKDGTAMLVAATEWSAPAGKTDDLDIRLDLETRDGRASRSSLTAFDGLPPATSYENGGRITTVAMPLDDVPAGEYLPKIVLERRDTMLVLDGDRSTRLETKKTEPLGSVSLPPITVSPR